jgi:hypothetical protein
MSALSNPTAVMNNVPFAYKPNSMKHNDGKGERKTRIKSTGGKNRQKVDTTDMETAFCTGSFTLISDDVGSAAVDSWRDLFDGNVLTLTENGNTQTFQHLNIINHVEKQYGMDAVIEVEFTSDEPV